MTRGVGTTGGLRAAALALGLLAAAGALGTVARGDGAGDPDAEPAAEVRAAATEAAAAGDWGPVTGLALPRFVSLKAREARARRGPSLDHRVDWLYQRRGLPLRVTAEHGNWRRVEDIEGLGGWVHHGLISGTRTVIVLEDVTMLRRPADGAPAVARLEAGVIARLGECRDGWCRLDAGGHRGWAPMGAVWGAESR